LFRKYSLIISFIAGLLLIK